MGHHEVDDAELELVRGLRARHNQSVATFLERYRPLLLHCIGSFEQDHSTRDDLFQDVVLHVFDRLDADAFDPAKGSFGTWLYRVAWCRVVDLRRRESGGRKVRLTMTGDQIPERADQAPGPSDTASTDEVGQLVRRGLAHLDPEDRVLLVLRFVDEHRPLEVERQRGRGDASEHEGRIGLNPPRPRRVDEGGVAVEVERIRRVGADRGARPRRIGEAPRAHQHAAVDYLVELAPAATAGSRARTRSRTPPGSGCRTS